MEEVIGTIKLETEHTFLFHLNPLVNVSTYVFSQGWKIFSVISIGILLGHNTYSTDAKYIIILVPKTFPAAKAVFNMNQFI